MQYFILKFFIMVVSIEALTELIIKSEIFEPLRNFFLNRKSKKLCGFINNILQCPYCFSVWASLIVICMSYNSYSIFILYVLCMHRLSNVCHNIFDKLYY